MRFMQLNTFNIVKKAKKKAADEKTAQKKEGIENNNRDNLEPNDYNSMEEVNEFENKQQVEEFNDQVDKQRTR